MPKCKNDEKSILGFSSPLIFSKTITLLLHKKFLKIEYIASTEERDRKNRKDADLSQTSQTFSQSLTGMVCDIFYWKYRCIMGM